MSSPVLVQMALRQASCDEPDPFPPKAITVDGPPPPSWGPKAFLCASLVPPGPLPTSPVRGEAPRFIFGRRVPRGGGGLCGLGAALQWTSCCFLGQQTLAQRARRPWLARVELVGELVRKAQLGHQPNLGFCLLVSQQTLALYFFLAFFALLLFFCWRLGIAAGAAGTRLGCHLALLQWWFTFYTPEARRNTGKQNASARARQRRLLFLGPRQDEAAKYLSVNFTRRPVPRGSFRGLLARRTTH